MLALTDSTFTAHLAAADRLVLVEFWASWCAPCRMVAPILEEIAAEYSAELEVVKVDTDACPETVRSQQVMGMPTMNLYRRGELIGSIVGARSKYALLRELSAHMDDGAPVLQ